MTENTLNPFEVDVEEYATSVDNRAVDRELASEQQEQGARKTTTDVSDHAHLFFSLVVFDVRDK